MVREGEQGEREMREMEVRQEREMKEMREKLEREMRKKHIGEKAQLEIRLKNQEKAQKQSVLKLKKMVEDLLRKLEIHEDDPKAGSA